MKQIIVTTPGRICLFGDHQDYLELPVIASAIDKKLTLHAEINTDDIFRISMPDINQVRNISISESFETLANNDHLGSVLRVAKRYGCYPNHGYNIHIKSEIPINAGVSSSSAVVVAWTHFLLKAFGCNQPVNSELIAQIAYEAEVLEHNSPGGRMDQFSIAIGNTLLINTGENFSYRKFQNRINGLVLGQSGVPKETIRDLSRLRLNAQKALSYIKEKVPSFKLKSTTIEEVESFYPFIPKKLHRYFYAAVKNHSITQLAAIEMDKDILDYEKLGQLMNEHHLVLKTELDITTPLIDAMVDAALNTGAYGAKIVGSGGGGSIIAMAPEFRERDIINAIKSVGAKNASLISVANGSMAL